MNGFLVTLILKLSRVSVRSVRVRTGTNRDGMQRRLKVMRVLLIAIAIFVAVLFAGNIEYRASAQPSQNTANQNQNKPDKNPQSTSTPTATPQGQTKGEVPHAGSPDNHSQDSQQPAEDSTWLTSWIQAIVAMLLFVVVILQTYIADQQRKIMAKQIEASELLERGYMGIADMTLSNLVVGGRPIVTIKWVNGGRTPVRNFRAMPVIVFGKEPVTNKIHFIDDDTSPIRSSFFPVGAEREQRYEVPDIIEAEDWAKFERGQVQLFIMGAFIYRDINGRKRKELISAMYDRFEDHIYETYEYASAEQSLKLVKPT